MAQRHERPKCNVDNDDDMYSPGRSWKNPRPHNETYPVDSVTYAQAVAFCAFEGKRLPTSDEWVWAERGGPHQWTYPWGDDKPDETRANLAGKRTRVTGTGMNPDGHAALPGYGEGRFEYTAPVGSYPTGANPWGVLDLVGNVSEVVADKGPKKTEHWC